MELTSEVCRVKKFIVYYPGTLEIGHFSNTPAVQKASEKGEHTPKKVFKNKL